MTSLSEGPKFDLEEMVQGYIDAAGFCFIDEDTTYPEFSKEANEQAKADCADFYEVCKEVLDELIKSSKITSSAAGGDFYYTRNGHGTGFWDRGLGEAGQTLSTWAKVHGSADTFCGTDNLIYFH
jgi:hypothetical protein